MKLLDYYRLTKPTSISCLKISGVIFTSLCFIITFIPGTAKHTILDYVTFFALCLLLGNSFGALILLVGFFSAYFKAKHIFNLYYSIPESIRNELELQLIVLNYLSKYNFLEMQIYCDKYELPITIEKSAGKKTIRIIALSEDFNSNNSQNKIREANKKYSFKKISLTGMGYSKIVNPNEFKLWNKDDFENAFMELIQVTKNES